MALASIILERSARPTRTRASASAGSTASWASGLARPSRRSRPASTPTSSTAPSPLPRLGGGLAALVVSFLVCVVGCAIAPQKFDWQVMREGIHLVGGDGGEGANVLGEDWESKPEFLEAAKKWIAKWAWGLSIFMCVIWPL